MAPVAAHRNSDRDGEYGEESVAYKVTKPFDPTKLEAELVDGHGEGPVPLVIEGDISSASEEEPVVLWLLRGDVKASLVHKVVDHHEIKEHA